MADDADRPDVTPDDPDETLTPSALKPTSATPEEVEGQVREDYSLRSAAPEYRRRFALLYRWLDEFKAAHFPNTRRMRRARLSIGVTSPRRFSETRLTTDYGAPTNIVLSERVVFGTDRRLIRTDDPDSPGWHRFIRDRVLGEVVKQYVLEELGSAEEAWDGYGPLYAREATRIGAEMGVRNPADGLPEVHARRQKLRVVGVPAAALWPHAFRPDGYYLGDVSFDHLLLRGCRGGTPVRRAAVPGVFEYLHLLAATGQHVRLLDVLGRQVDAATEARSPAVTAFERSPRDASGMPLPLPEVDPGWLAWHDGCVRLMAEGILARRAFDVMPILAEALQDAGCEELVLLGHLRAHTAHTANCWALASLTPKRPS